MQTHLSQLRHALDGELHFDPLHRSLYATDASVYREVPLAVCYPKTVADIQRLIAFATEHGSSLIPRAAGTSLAGQCVGSGIVVDVSKHWNQILEINVEERWVRVQPGVIRDELNFHLKKHGLHFGPNTSTANRCMIGGMVGNNSCGSSSIVHGSTRDHLLEVEAVLSDGSVAVFGPGQLQLPAGAGLRPVPHMQRTPSAHASDGVRKTVGTGQSPAPAVNEFVQNLYDHIVAELSDPTTQQRIQQHFPKPTIHRRNTGYAVDLLLDQQPFNPDGPPLNLCTLLAGSEGTLAFTTAVKLNLVPLPPPHPVVLAAHFSSLDEAMQAVLVIMQHQPDQCELMDKTILDLTKGNREQNKNRFFVEGDPAVVLTVEFRGESLPEAREKAVAVAGALRSQGLGYAYPLVEGKDCERVWTLRSAGLGILSNLPGDAKPVACIEDTAVALPDLPAYIAEFQQLMAAFGQKAVYYAHAGAGELHLRPILNLKKSAGVQLFHDISLASAKLVKKYGGSLSGEHGDGRVRAEFIPLMLGEENYDLLRRIKKTWDPHGIFNPGKIVDAAPMTEDLRYAQDVQTPDYQTVFDFSDTGGILRMAEKCNGSGDCRRLDLSGGTMCPSYRATRDEKDSTRARANMLREILSSTVRQFDSSAVGGAGQTGELANWRTGELKNPFAAPELAEVLDLCLSCKGCTSECPSNVDMTTLKAEVLHQRYRTEGVPLRAKLFGNIAQLNRWLSLAPGLANFFMGNAVTGGLLKRLMGIAPQRSLPPLRPWPHNLFGRPSSRGKNTAREEGQPNEFGGHGPGPRKVIFFLDEFTRYYDSEIGMKAVQLLQRLGYEVELPPCAESGRAHLSKGLLPQAKKLARENVRIFSKLVSEKTPLIGIEPSAILGFRDEYLRLVEPDELPAAQSLAANSLLIDEFLAQEIQAGRITPEHFTKEKKKILLHGHCHQKALSNVEASAWVVGLPENYEVELVPSGCCGMAGSFGYEREHYELSQQIGELVLFPALRAAPAEVLVAAPGTSCRHQILDGTGRRALHPVEVLWGAWKI